MFKRIAAAWEALTTHLAKHRGAKRAAKEYLETQRKIEANYVLELRSLPKTLAGIKTMKEVYYRKGVLFSNFSSLEERADARIGGLRTPEEIEAIADVTKRFQAKCTQIQMSHYLRQYCLEMWKINAKAGNMLDKPV